MNNNTPRPKTNKLLHKGFFHNFDSFLPKAVLFPTFIIAGIFIYGFIGWTIWVSLTGSRLLPNFELKGFAQYITLFTKEPRWWVAVWNLLIFSVLFISICIVIGLSLAVFLDQKIRGEAMFRTIYLYPMALSFIVTGSAWRWILNPDLGLERLVRQLGFSEFTFRWLVESDMAIYTIVIAAVWQSSGFVMALFLSGLRSIDQAIIKAAQIDGASLPRIYRRIIIPSLRPVFLSAIIILLHIAIKSFDLVMVLTRGGPGYATDMPATFMYAFSFNRGRLAFGAASAVVMFLAIMAIIIPYLYLELKGTRNER